MTVPRLRPTSLIGAAVLLVAGTALGVVLTRGGSLLVPARHTTIDQSVVIERLESVAKLVTTEAMVRDVVTYRQSWLGSTKRALVIVTGKALVGVDLRVQPQVTVRESDRHIRLVFPHASLLGVDITELRTYDESRGLWNPFHPADRDTIFLLARRQLAGAARELAVIEHAERSARSLIEGLFEPEGWTVEVVFGSVVRPDPAAGDRRP